MRKTIMMKDYVGAFAENKDKARAIRLEYITPVLKKDDGIVVLDFEGVTGATQSFVHALISQLIRKYESEVFNRLLFKNCNATVQEVVNIVADYMEAA